MKFHINRDHFSNGLAMVLGVVGTKASMPILSNVLIEAGADHISLSTTNLDLGVRCKVKAQIKERGSITLPVKRLATIIRELPNADVAFEASQTRQVKIVSGGSAFKIVGIGAEEFPRLPDSADDKSHSLEQADLAAMLTNVDYAQSTDETRYILNGVYFNFKGGKLSLVATDGRRLAMTTHELPHEAKNAGAIILPARAVDELQRILGKGDKVKVAFNERRAAFEIATNKDADSGLTDSVYLFSKVVEGNYPNYQQVIPKEVHQRITIERELFLRCVHRAALVTSEKSNSIRFKLTANLLEIRASSPDFGEAHESFAVSYAGPELQVAFNPQLIMDPLRALTKDEIVLELKDETSPGVIKAGDHFLCVVMPVRLS